MITAITLLFLAFVNPVQAACEEGVEVSYTRKGGAAESGCLLRFKDKNATVVNSSGEKVKLLLDSLLDFDIVLTSNDGEQHTFSILEAEKVRKHEEAAEASFELIQHNYTQGTIAGLHNQALESLLERSSDTAKSNLFVAVFLEGKATSISSSLATGDWTYTRGEVRVVDGTGEVLEERRQRIEVDLRSASASRRIESRQHSSAGVTEWVKDKEDPVGGREEVAAYLFAGGASKLRRITQGVDLNASALGEEEGSTKSVFSGQYVAMHPNGEEFTGYKLYGQYIVQDGTVVLEVKRRDFSQYGAGEERTHATIDLALETGVLAALQQDDLDLDIWDSPSVQAETAPTALDVQLKNWDQIIEERRIAFEEANRNVLGVQVLEVYFSSLNESGQCIDFGCDPNTIKNAVQSLGSTLKYLGPEGAVVGEAISGLSSLGSKAGEHFALPDYQPQVQAPQGMFTQTPLSMLNDSASYTFPLGFWHGRQMRLADGSTIVLTGIDVDDTQHDTMGTLVITLEQLNYIAENGGVGYVFNRGIKEGRTPPILCAKVMVSKPVFRP